MRLKKKHFFLWSMNFEREMAGLQKKKGKSHTTRSREQEVATYTLALTTGRRCAVEVQGSGQYPECEHPERADTFGWSFGSFMRELISQTHSICSPFLELSNNLFAIG
jgi:hypothetical protein